MTIEMAEIMMRVKPMRPRAKRLLNAIIPHAIALETLELEEDALALLEIIDADELHAPKWKAFLHKLGEQSRKAFDKVRKPKAAKAAEEEAEAAD